MVLSNDQIIQIIIGLSAMIAAILIVAIVVLNKVFGLIHFGKPLTESEKRKDIPLKQPILCPAHDEMKKNHEALAANLKSVSDNQIKNMEKHEQHQRSFESGEKKMKQMSNDIKNLCIGVAVLLDRSPLTQRKLTVENVNLDVNSLIKLLAKPDIVNED